MQSALEAINGELELLKKNNNFRSLKPIDAKYGKYITVNGRRLVNLCSNNYLGIGGNKKYENEFFKNYYSGASLSSSSSRLLTGNEAVYSSFEELLAERLGDRCLLFNSGYSANLGILSTLVGKNDVVFSDKLNHASIVDGIALSGAKMLRWRHGDYDHLEKLLAEERDRYERAIIVSESLFSMDGDFCSLEILVELKNRYNCLLMVDESHSFGVYGEKGEGYCFFKGQLGDLDIFMAGLGKACGSFGAFCVAHSSIIDYLINGARSFIFSTAIAPINVAWSKFVVEKVLPYCREERETLTKLTNKFRVGLESIGISTSGDSFIVPILMKKEGELQKLQEKLLEASFYALPIRYPTVPKNSPRFRISITANMTEADIDCLLAVLENFKHKC